MPDANDKLRTMRVTLCLKRFISMPFEHTTDRFGFK